MQQQVINYDINNQLDEEININFKKLFNALLYRRMLIVKVFFSVLLFFVLMTFILPKKWEAGADLYINKTNNTNYSEINPFLLESGGGSMVSMGMDKAMNNELELMKSSLVMDNVIKENDLKYGRLFKIFPLKKTGKYISAKAFVKSVSIENKKNTNVISIKYKSKKKDKAYGVVNSIIQNYIKLHQEINSEKSKSDKRIIEEEYNKAKEALDKKIKSSKGLPANAVSGMGNLASMSAFSSSAQKAMGTLHGQYTAGEKSRIDLSEEAEKFSQLSAKLEWAKLVEEMSNSSKVLVINEPKPLNDWEYASPKLFKNIMLGIIFGFAAAIAAFISAEIRDKKLAFSMLGNNVIYNIDKDFMEIKALLLENKYKVINAVIFDGIELDLIKPLQQFRNVRVVRAEVSEDFISSIERASGAVLILRIGESDSRLYKYVKNAVRSRNKEIYNEVLV